MDEIYKKYLHLSAEQLKLLCFLAYLGKSKSHKPMAKYGNDEKLTSRQLLSLLSTLKPYFYAYYYYDTDYDLTEIHQAPLLVYLLCEHPDWLRTFEQRYIQYQSEPMKELIAQLRLCMMGRFEGGKTRITKGSICDILIPLSMNKAFLPLMKTISADLILSFIDMAESYHIKNDFDDTDDILGSLAREYYLQLSPSLASILKSVIAFYNYIKRGEYDASATAYNIVYSNLLAAFHSLYTCDYATAFKQMTQAMRNHNENRIDRYKGYFNITVCNYALVMAYHLYEKDQHKKLSALVKKDYFINNAEFFPFVQLAQYLLDGLQSMKSKVNSFLKACTYPTNQYFALLLVRFFHLDVNLPSTVTTIPRLHFLRHELSQWLELSDKERQQLEKEYDGKPLITHIRFKQQWELVLEELSPKNNVANDSEQKARVSYVVNKDRVEIREQNRLKNGGWGAGKRMTIERFRKGTDFMNETDRKIAASIRGWFNHDIDVRIIIPHLVGSDRVYTGWSAPLEPVTIVEEKPYLIIERTKNGFTVKSNMNPKDLDKSVVYRKDNDHQYSFIPLTQQQQLYYKKILAIEIFPLEAEATLRQFLPKVSNVVEVHSDLVEGGSTLQQRDGSPILSLQVTPMAGTRNMFILYCMARPLPDGITLFDPGIGLNPCVAEAGGTRYQVTRDIRRERSNLKQLQTFIYDNNLIEGSQDIDTIDEPFADHKPVYFSAEELLQTMLFIQEHPDKFAIEWPEGGQLNLKTADTSKWNIGLKSKNGWFEVEGEIPIDDDTILTASQLLQLVAQSSQKGFIRLGEGQFMAITERLRKQLARLESLTTSNRGHLQISEMHASLLGAALSGEIMIKHDKKIEKLQEKIEKSMSLTPTVPKTLKAQLRDYQQDGFLWLCRMTGWGAGVCLADDMGLGKTVQTIAFLLHTQRQGAALIAAPASVVLNWRRELQRFAPSLNVVILNSAVNRQETIQQAREGDVVLTTYGLFVTEASHLQEKEWNTICLDEAHVIKNRDTKTSQAVMQLKAHNRIILTGTPVQNHLGELWNLYQFINPGLLGSYDQFSQKYILPIEQQDNKERSKQLRRIIRPFILRRTKQEVIEELPEKQDIIMPVELSDEEMAVYEVIRRKAKELLEEEKGSSPSVNTLAEITRLRQAACAPQLAEKKWAGGESAKVTLLMQLVSEITEGGNSVLVFSQFTSFLTIIRKALDKAGVKYAYLDGSVPMAQRDKLVQEFQHGLQQVFLISLKAGGLGLNLTGANYVIHLDPWWNPAIEQQATDRAYRIGQQQNVTVYHFIAQHTIEEKILRLHETKRNLADAMLEGTSQSHKLTSRDLLNMIAG
ncbi:MAG: DEAD/DEAH box helicase [Prevotella sp.]|nr:DEAD/DEAH box helicase [Prevotella sp.]